MSYFDDASLVLIPSGYKDQKLYAVKPLSGDGDLTFSRASNATRVASNGLIEKVRTNLALYSEQFDNAAYTKLNATVTANAVANPLNGAVTADKIVEDTASGLHRVGQEAIAVTSGVPITFSFIAKAGERTELEVQRMNTSGTVFNTLSNNIINLTTGVVPAITNATSYGSVSLGNGWFRYYITLTPIASATGGLNLGLVDGSGNVSYTGDGTSGAFVFGFQAEIGDVMTDYIATTTTAVSVGPVSGLPRLDYLNSSCPRLLLEPQRTNILPQSNYFGAADWVKINGSIATNQATSPEGIGNASTFTEDTSSGFHVVYDNIVAAFSTAHTLSAFVKPNGRNIMYLRMENASTGSGLGITFFNISTGQILTDSSTSSSIEAYANGWYRVSITATTPAAQSTLFAIGLADADNSRSYTGDGTSGIYLYGAQAEPSATYPTSLIPTNGTSVTRVQDLAYKTSATAIIGQTEGTIFVEAVFKSGYDSNNLLLTLSNGATNLIYLNRSNGGLEAFVTAAGTTQMIYTGSVLAAGIHKVALAYKANDFAVYLDGNLVHSDTSGSVPACDKINLGSYYNNSLSYNDGISQALLFKTRLTNAQLAELTTL